MILALDLRVAGGTVFDDRACFLKASGDIRREVIERSGLPVAFSRERDLEILDG